MGAFLFAPTRGDEPARGPDAAADRALRQQGFADGTTFPLADGHLTLYPSLLGRPPLLVRDREGLAASVTGTVFYGPDAGATALARLAADVRAATVDRDALFGSFCALVVTDRGLVAQGDPMGTYHVFLDRRDGRVATSLLALLAERPSPAIDRQAVYEYVFDGASFGGATPFRDIALLDATGPVTLRSASAENGAVPVTVEAPAPAEALVEAIHERLVARFRTMAASVPCLNTAISGGYDSRLILALCLEIGATTRLHVYGRPDDADVRIARAIADALRLDVTHADKSAARQGPGCFEDNVLKFDGTPPDGIADDGADLATRIDAFADGALALNGGGGEILRDFYDLPDRRYTTRQVLAAFHRQFDARALPPAHDLNTYLDALAAKAQRAIGARAEDLSRTEIELLYGALRCRYWMGRNNSINNRFGAFVTPFIDAGLVADALRIPMAAKRLGRFEAALIRRAHPRLAGLPSAYGHAFDQAPSLGHVLDEWGALVRPTWLRGRMHRVKWAMRPRTMPPPPAPLDLDLPFMRRLLRLDHVTDDAQWRRVWALEYLFGKVDARLD